MYALSIDQRIRVLSGCIRLVGQGFEFGDRGLKHGRREDHCSLDEVLEFPNVPRP